MNLQTAFSIFLFNSQVSLHKYPNTRRTSQDQYNQSSGLAPNPGYAGSPIPKRIAYPHSCVFSIIPLHINDGSRIHCCAGPKPHWFTQLRRVHTDTDKQHRTSKHRYVPNDIADHGLIPFPAISLTQNSSHCNTNKKRVPLKRYALLLLIYR